MINGADLPDAPTRFDQARHAYEQLTMAGLEAVGFDHFARPEDPLAVAMRGGRLHRNFQGFTDDHAETLLGLGASAISQFQGSLLQNEKNAGRYHLRIANSQFATARGIRRSAAERHRGAIIESLLCHGSADCEGLPDLHAIHQRARPFVDHALARWSETGTVLVLEKGGWPYARSIAALFDPYRVTSVNRFSNAV